MSAKPVLKPLVISAPFGNWVSSAEATSTLGTYTLRNRAGRLRWYMAWRILKTLRRHRRLGAWTNSLGLPSPGIASLIWRCERLEHEAREKYCEDKILSIYGFDEQEWQVLIRDIVRSEIQPLALECNASCPHVGRLSVPDWLFSRLVDTGIPVIVKLPPVNWKPVFERARGDGVLAFHACNTLPTPAGGMSGKPLKAVSLDVVKAVKDMAPEALVIGGGGITSPEDVDDYARAGADRFAVGSALLSGWHLLFPWTRRDFLLKLAARARTRVYA